MPPEPVRRTYKYRFYPTSIQEVELSRTFGCVRLVYNKALHIRSEAWHTERRRIGYHKTSALLTSWKKTEELAFLNEVSSVPLQQALRHLQSGFVAFWQGRTKYPRFKSKRKSRASAEYTRSAFNFRNGQLRLAKMTEPLTIVWSRPLPEGAEPTTITVSRDSAGRWFVCLLMEDRSVKPLPYTTRTVGLDIGLTSLVTLSNGEKISNPKHESRDRKRLAFAQRRLARKTRGSRNRIKARRKVARINARISDQRTDYLHKLTTRLVRENQTIVVEDLNVRGMLKNHKLARAISDASWYQLRYMLDYKCRWYGRELVTVDRWFPSTKICSICWHKYDERLPLTIRE